MENLIPNLWGQESAGKLLAKNIFGGRVASSYLFTGADGTGKTTAAITFARALLCELKAEAGCSCCSCVNFDKGRNQDFMAVIPTGTKSSDKRFEELLREPSQLGQAEGNMSIKKEQAELLIAELRKKPCRAGGRLVAIIDGADSMNSSTANAILKTLEEPPPSAVIILISSNQAGLLPTIVSRCREVRFLPLSPSALSGRLVKRLGLPEAEATHMAHIAEGCPGIALRDGLTASIRLDEEAADLLAEILDMKAVDVSLFASGWKDRRQDVPLFFERIMEILRMAAKGRPHFAASSDRMNDALDRLSTLPPQRLVDGYNSVFEKKPVLVYNPNVPMLMESTLFNLKALLVKGEPLAG